MEKKNIAFLVGMPRAATTFLYHNFSAHPHIFIPFRRKTNYFSLHYEEGEEFLYSHFDDAPDDVVAIDTETFAFFNKDLPSPERIHEFNKDARIILCVREPSDWIVSFYRQISTFDHAIPSFETFLHGGYTLVEDNKGIQFNMKPGDVADRIEEYERLFPESLLILKFSDVVQNPLDALKAIERHLGVPSYYNASNIVTGKINSSDRTHSKFINKLLRNEKLINLLKQSLPRSVVLAIRLNFDRLSETFKGKNKSRRSDDHLAEFRAVAKKFYAEDTERLERDFD